MVIKELPQAEVVVGATMELPEGSPVHLPGGSVWITLSGVFTKDERIKGRSVTEMQGMPEKSACSTPFVENWIAAKKPPSDATTEQD